MELNNPVSCIRSHDPTQTNTVKHSYGTRIRSNSVLRPSIRLLQSPDPPAPLRKIRPAPTATKPVRTAPDQPPFPPPNVVLHADDATNKVFLAIGRALQSVDNRAMTVKDLADMTLKFGLVCQNVSAASQAITTYIRNHMARCDAQGDQPLLVRHVLSGTRLDDSLLPALHSRSGGAHNKDHTLDRATNFRRGTVVWYLSRATGAPCPFTRAGISLCDHSNRANALKPSNRERMPEVHESKRQRMMRRCAGRENYSASSEDERPRLPKVKLTLRLRPSASSTEATASTPLPSAPLPACPEDIVDLSHNSDPLPDDTATLCSIDHSEDTDDEQDDEQDDQVTSNSGSDSSDDDAMSVDSSSTDDSQSSSWRADLHAYVELSDSDSNIDAFSPSSRSDDINPSPSATSGSAPPPPDSEDGDYFTMEPNGSWYDRDDSPIGSHEWDSDFNDIDPDSETQWESPGPRSPSAPAPNTFSANVVVKQEPLDVMDPWEKIDGGVCNADPFAGVATVPDVSKGQGGSQVKLEDFGSCDSEGTNWSWPSDWLTRSITMDTDVQIKQEEMEFETSLTSACELDAASPLSPYSSVSADSLGYPRHGESVWRDVELLGPEHVHPREFDELHGPSRSGTVRARAKTYPTLPSFSSRASSSGTAVPDLTPPSAPALAPTPTPPTPLPERDFHRSFPTVFPTQVTQEPASLEAVVPTCQPCTPPVSAVQVEGIYVYQTTLGPQSLLRRIDTDFVNLSPIVHFLGIPPPSNVLPDSTLITHGSPRVTGLWVPLPVALSFCKEHPLPPSLFDIFLSAMLWERFPSVVQDLYKSKSSMRLLNHFGPHFQSTLDQRRMSIQTETSSADRGRVTWEQPRPDWDVVQDHMLTTHPPYPASLAFLLEPELDVVHTPLSPTEQEIFHSLCANPEWETESDPSATAPSAPSDETMGEDVVQMARKPARCAPEPRALRRSKRVANIIATTQPGPVTRSRRLSAKP